MEHGFPALAATGIQIEHLVLSRRLAGVVADMGHCTESDATDKNGHERLGIHLETIGTERNVETTGVPESSGLIDTPVVRGTDKHLDHQSVVLL